MDRKHGLFVATWKPKPAKEVPEPLTGKEFRLEQSRPYYPYVEQGAMRPATVEEYIKWCRSNWPTYKDGGDRTGYQGRALNDPDSGSVDLWYMVKPFMIPELHGANSFDIIIPSSRWMSTCVPTKPNRYMKYEKYPDIGHNAVYGPNGTTSRWDLIMAYDHPWFHKRYPLTIGKAVAENRARDIERALWRSELRERARA